METVMHNNSSCRPWKISVHAKAKNFDLKFTASKILPSWETRFSVFIKVHSFLLRLRSETGGGGGGGGGDTSVSSQTTTTTTTTRRLGNKNSRSLLKSKFLTFFDRLFSTTTTTLKRIISRLNKVVDDFVEKRRRGRRGTGGGGRFKSEFLILLDKFRGVKRRGVIRNKKIPGYSSKNGFPEMLPRQGRPCRVIRYYKQIDKQRLACGGAS